MLNKKGREISGNLHTAEISWNAIVPKMCKSNTNANAVAAVVPFVSQLKWHSMILAFSIISIPANWQLIDKRWLIATPQCVGSCATKARWTISISRTGATEIVRILSVVTHRRILLCRNFPQSSGRRGITPATLTSITEWTKIACLWHIIVIDWII